LSERLEHGVRAGAEWVLRPGVAAVLFGASLLLIVASVALVPTLIRRLPVDYFVTSPPPRPRTARAIAGWTARNLLGLILV